MRVFVGCEYSGIVRDAFIAAGHDAISCDLLDTESPGPHIKGDVIKALEESDGYDLAILHPPCTYLAVSGNRWYAGTDLRQQAIEWTADLWKMAYITCDRIALENPVGVLSTAYRPPDQYIQPWEYGHPESKKTGLWLCDLPCLQPTHEKPEKIETRVWSMGPSPDRGKLRSRFFEGVAAAMAEQWGSLND